MQDFHRFSMDFKQRRQHHIVTQNIPFHSIQNKQLSNGGKAIVHGNAFRNIKVMRLKCIHLYDNKSVITIKWNKQWRLRLLYIKFKWIFLTCSLLRDGIRCIIGHTDTIKTVNGVCVRASERKGASWWTMNVCEASLLLHSMYTSLTLFVPWKSL